MKLFEFYKKLHEVEAAPITDCGKLITAIKTPTLAALGVVSEDTFCINCLESDFYTDNGVPEVQSYCECCPEVEDEVEEPVSDSSGVTDAFRTTVNDGFSRFGCPFLFNVRTKNDTKLTELRTAGTNPAWQATLVNKIEYVNGIIGAQRCEEESTSVTTHSSPPIQPTEPTPTNKEVEKTETSTSIEQSFEKPSVIPEPIYPTEDELVNIGAVQNDELIGDLQIELDEEIIRQLPEVQQRLKQFKIDAEKISYVIPLTLEAKNFMMELEMSGVKLPYLMLYYENTDTLYEAMKQNNYVEFKKLQPLTNRVNYKEFWEWTKNLWENNNTWLKTKIKGTIPEFDKSTILP
jgi:hypothetical protein